MSFADYFLGIILCLSILNLLLMIVNSFLQEKIESYKQKNTKFTINNNQSETIFTETRYFSKIYHYFQEYAEGLTRYNLILTGKIPSHRIRKIIYKYVFRMKIAKKTIIYGGCEVRSPWNIHIGNSTIASGCVLDGRYKILIGDNVVFGSFVHVWTAEHDYNDPYFRTLEHNKQPVIIDDRAWICSDSTLLPGVHIKEGAVVAARACVTKGCEAFTVYGGVPAKKIADRNRDLRYEITGRPFYRFY